MNVRILRGAYLLSRYSLHGGLNGRAPVLLCGIPTNFTKHNNFATQAKFNSPKRKANASSGPDVPVPKKNDEIIAESVRLVSKDADGKSTNQIMSIAEARAKATSLSMDLIMVNDKASPPIVKLDLFEQMLMEKATDIKVKKRKAKVLELKEMLVRTNIATNDMSRKLNQVRHWLVLGAQVKITIVSSWKIEKANPQSIDQALIKVTEYLENYASSVQEPKQVNPMRITFLVSPFSGVELKNIQAKSGVRAGDKNKTKSRLSKEEKNVLFTERAETANLKRKHENSTGEELQVAVVEAAEVVREMKKKGVPKDELRPAV
jgi:translation initiation factor IF-3